MLKSARSSAKAVLVAAGAAGFVALGAGIAGADTLDTAGATDAKAPQGVAPTTGDLPGTVHSGVQMVRKSVESPNLAHTLPAPRTTNLSTPADGVPHDAAHQLLTPQGAVADAQRAVEAQDVPSVAQGGELPQANGVQDRLPLRKEAVGGAAEMVLPTAVGAADSVVEGTGQKLPLSGVSERLPNSAPLTVNGAETALPTADTPKTHGAQDRVGDKAEDTEADAKEQAEDTEAEAKERAWDAEEDAKERAGDAVQGTEDKAGGVKDGAQDRVGDKAEDTEAEAKEQAEDAEEDAKDKAGDVKDGAQDRVQDKTDNTVDSPELQ